MAKFEEGDARWIVNDLGDSGQNVNNWHWREYDALEWAKEQLVKSFVGRNLLVQGDLSLMVESIQVEGEAVINNRKNKLIPAYELDITLKWKGQCPDLQGKSAIGRVQLPYVSDENHDEVPEVKFSSETDDDISQRLRTAFFDNGKKNVVDLVNKIVLDLRSGGPVKSGSKAGTDSEVNKSQAKINVVPTKPEVIKREAAAHATESGKSLSITEKFFARPADLFECFVIDGKVRAYTQSNATIEARPEGQFSWFNGSIVGQFEELVSNEKIVMKWRFSTWEDACFSKVTISLSAPEPGTTILKLHQTGIPHQDKFGQAVMDQVETGWRAQILNRIRQVFGYGA